MWLNLPIPNDTVKRVIDVADGDQEKVGRIVLRAIERELDRLGASVAEEEYRRAQVPVVRLTDVDNSNESR